MQETTASSTTRTAAPTKPKSADNQGSVKETIESILVAFILAFIFRAFVVEAFVIPTGSMAPTLLGAHMRFRCPDCGYQFPVNYTATDRGGETIIPPNAQGTYRVHCPNCGYRIPQFDPSDAENSATNPPVFYGDRILVLKYLYLIQDPKRWDVIVFKSPDKEPDLSPPTYTQNYIKRLIGKPGESIMILDGDIYVGDQTANPQEFLIQAKPHYAQEALWRVIYDNDYYPQGLNRNNTSPWKQPWAVQDGTGWTGPRDPSGQPSTSAPARRFTFNNLSGASTIRFDATANAVGGDSNRHAFTDWLAYDIEVPNAYNVMHDLKLSFFYERSAGDGPLEVQLTSRDDAFVAVLTPSDAKLFHKVNRKTSEQIGPTHPLKSGSGPVHVELANADYRVTLRIDDQDVAQTTPQQYHPDVPALLKDYEIGKQAPIPTVEIAASNQTAQLSHIGLWRDIYYINVGTRTTDRTISPFAGTPRNIMRLGPKEYFVLGDNSLISGDARYWTIPIDLPADELHVAEGRVPDRFLLGRAFFVYWPAGFRPLPMAPALAPDFGDMRFIR